MSYDPRYAKQWNLDRLRGIPRTVDATRTREHVAALTRHVSLTSIAEVASVGNTTLHHIATGRTTRVRHTIAERILAVDLSAVYTRQARRGFVPNLGARRRIEGLLALGWRHSDITDRLPISTNSAAVLNQAGDWITRATHDAVNSVYDELSGTRGPSETTRRRAARSGYLPPLWWDDDTIDDPTHTPTLTDRRNRYDVDLVNVDRAVAGTPTTLTRGERLEAVRRLHRRGLGYAPIAERLRVGQRQVHRDLTDLGLVAAKAVTVVVVEREAS